MIKDAYNKENEPLKKSDKSSEIFKDKFTIYFGLNNINLNENRKYPNNKIITTKYNLPTFIPKSLLLQFRKAANIYFLVVSILCFMPFSPISPASQIGTFIFVLACTIVKEGIEDYGRYKQDKLANNRLVWKYSYEGWIKVKCWTLMPGDIIKIEKDEEFSADTLMIQTSNKTGFAYVETKSLDGETNLKEKVIIDVFKNCDNKFYSTFEGEIETDEPNEYLNYWKGKILSLKMNNDIQNNISNVINCHIKNLALKGCVLKNTDYVIGVIIYSGKNSKIMKNSKSARFKMSKVLKKMNQYLYTVFIVVAGLCSVFGYLCLIWDSNNEETFTYIFIQHNTKNKFLQLLTNICTYFVSYSQMIPISLYVVLEIIKVVQGFLIQYDDKIYDTTIDKPAGCRATDLIEELGQVEFIFSDKTGTLTQNSMVLKKIYVAGKVFGNDKDSDMAANAKFTINGDRRIEIKLKSKEMTDFKDKEELINFLYILSLCHNVFPEVSQNGSIIYQGASPDEVSLVKGAQQMGFEFKSKNFSTLTIKNEIDNTEHNFEIKAEIPFDSIRKRMSVVSFDPNTDTYELLSKGADTTMIPIISKYVDKDKNEVERVIKVLSKEGLRVLVMAKKTIAKDQFAQWKSEVEKAKDIEDEFKLNELYNQLETGLTFVGCSAIEDKLQEGVDQTIFTLLACNIRVWVLTGDKEDTALEIAKSCKLVNESMEIIKLVESCVCKDSNNKTINPRKKIEELQKQYDINNINKYEINLNDITRKIRKKIGKDLSLVVDGKILEEILSNEQFSLLFFHLAIAAKSVICCRVNPKQKSEVVRLVKRHGKWTTLSIGDGANDVPMILEAHIGIGIIGKEGTQAVRAADFSIGQFRFLQELLLTYGRIGYIKISKFICYYFYKNILLVFSDVIFAFSNGFSGQLYYPDYLTTMYNAIFTSWLCIFIFSLERDVNLKIVKTFPMLYTAGQKNYFFNLKIFWTYIIYAIIHGFVCFFLPELSMNDTQDNSGITMNHWAKATVGFSLMIHIVSYKLLVLSDFWNVVNLIAFAASLLLYYICLIALCSNFFAFKLQNELAGVIYYLIRSIKFWIIIIFGPFLALIFEISSKQIGYSGFPLPTDYIKQHLNDPVLKNILYEEGDRKKTLNKEKLEEKEIAERQIKIILKAERDKKVKEINEAKKMSTTTISNINKRRIGNIDLNNLYINNINLIQK